MACLTVGPFPQREFQWSSNYPVLKQIFFSSFFFYNLFRMRATTLNAKGLPLLKTVKCDKKCEPQQQKAYPEVNKIHH